MFCRECGRELEQGRKYCTACGASQQAEAGGGADGSTAVPPTSPAAGAGPVGGGAGGGMSRGVKVTLVSVLALVVVAGLATGLFFLLRGTSDDDVTKPPETRGDRTTTQGGQRLAYLDRGDLFTISLIGTSPVRLTRRGDIVDFAVAPDGSRMAFVTEEGEQRIIFKMKADGTDVSQVTLPEKGLAENPAFDPESRYIYFTRITPSDQAGIQEGRPYGVGFERYDIAANKVDHLYTRSGLQEQSVQGLWADPGGGALYFNLFGSDYPSSVPHRLVLGASAHDEVYMPMEVDDARYSAVAYQLLDFSPDGKSVSCYKQMLFASSDPEEGPGQRVDVCLRPVGGGGETAVAEYVPSASREGEVNRMEFSRGTDSRYYLSKVSSSSESALRLQFYAGRNGGELSALGLRLSLTLEPERYTPVVWHLLPVKRAK